MKYKPPKYILFYVYIFFLLYTFLFIRPQQSERVQLGVYELEKYNETKVNLNIFNIRELEIEIIETYQTNNQSLCKSGEIFIYGTLRNRVNNDICLLYTSPSPRDVEEARMPSSA